MKKEQSAKLLKEIEKFNFIKYNDLLTIQWNSFCKHIDLSFDNFYSVKGKLFMLKWKRNAAMLYDDCRF